MADKKKRLCPNIVLGADKKPKCGKEFEFDPDEWNGRCPHCSFPIDQLDRSRAVRELEEFEAAEAARGKKEEAKKPGGVLRNLARD